MKQYIILLIPILIFTFGAGYLKGGIDAKNQFKINQIKSQIIQQRKTDDIESKAIQTQNQYAIQYKYIIKEVIKYAQTNNANTILDSYWVRLYNDSISNAQTTSKSYAATASIVLNTATANNQACYQIREQLILLQEWINNNQ